MDFHSENPTVHNTNQAGVVDENYCLEMRRLFLLRSHEVEIKKVLIVYAVDDDDKSRLLSQLGLKPMTRRYILYG